MSFRITSAPTCREQPTQFAEPGFLFWFGKRVAMLTDTISVTQHSGAISQLRFVRAQPPEYLFGEFHDGDT
jgi:hypothetical protein